MNSPEVTSTEHLAGSGTLKGRLSQKSLPEVLSSLQAVKKTGVLSLVNAGVRKSVYFLDGQVVFAASSLTQDRLGDVLLRGGKITADEYLRLSNRIRGGIRLGKALVEGRVLSPKDLWWGIEQQVREIVWSLFGWEDGYFHFEEDDRPRHEKITVDLAVDVLIVEGLRRVDGTGAIREYFASPDSVYVKTGKDFPLEFEPHERHVFELLDGKRRIADICRESEIGEAETRKVLHVFDCVGVIKLHGADGARGGQEVEEAQSLAGIAETYNAMYRHLFRHMSGEVGPIAEIILEKYLNELKERPGSLFERVRLRRDGSLDPQQMEKNVLRLEESERQQQMVEALNELLYAELLAVKRTLGASHESQLIQTFRQMRGER